MLTHTIIIMDKKIKLSDLIFELQDLKDLKELDIPLLILKI